MFTTDAKRQNSEIASPQAEFELLKYDALHIEFALRKGRLVHITLKRPKTK